MRIGVYNIKGHIYIKDLSKNKMLSTKIYVGDCDDSVVQKAKRLVFSVFDKNKHNNLSTLARDVNIELLRRANLL